MKISQDIFLWIMEMKKCKNSAFELNARFMQKSDVDSDKRFLIEP